MSSDSTDRFVSRAGDKLAHAIRAFDVSVAGLVCADLGSSTGGFVDCLLHRGAARVYAVERGYGVLAYPLRGDARVVVMERTDALSVTLPEPVQLVTIDVGWTRQGRILPVARRLLVGGGAIITLVKPHYEAGPSRPWQKGTGTSRQALFDRAKRVRLGASPLLPRAASMLRGGVLPDELSELVLRPLREQLPALGLRLVGETESPIRGQAGNREFLWQLLPV